MLDSFAAVRSALAGFREYVLSSRWSISSGTGRCSEVESVVAHWSAAERFSESILAGRLFLAFLRTVDSKRFDATTGEWNNFVWRWMVVIQVFALLIVTSQLDRSANVLCLFELLTSILDI